MFPDRVRRMVLDSVVDPAGAWYQDNLDQNYAFQGRINAFFAWTAAANSTFRLGRTVAQVRAAFGRAMAQLTGHPLTNGEGRPVVGPDELTDTFLAGGYSNSFWPDLAGALAAYLNNRDGSDLVQLYQSVGAQGENEFAVYNAVECSDVNWPRDWATWNTDMQKANKTAPFETWANTWFNASCAFWPVKGPAQPTRIDGSRLPPILMLQGTLDAATPYAGALAARKRLPTARMVVVQGGGNHGQSLSSPPNQCVLGYLEPLPGHRRRCPRARLWSARRARRCLRPRPRHGHQLPLVLEGCCAPEHGERPRCACSPTTIVRKCSRSAIATRSRMFSSARGSARSGWSPPGWAARSGVTPTAAS